MDELDSDKTGKRERTKLRNRSVILDAAREVFVEIGYEAASVRDIVARTDLAPGTFYNYFPDKHSVLLALVGEASSLGTRLVREARARAKTLEERVYVGFRAYFEFIASDRALFELMRRNMSTLRSLGLDETGFAEGLADLEAELRQAVRIGVMPALPIDYMTRAVGAMTFELGAAMAAHDPADVDGATHFAAELCLGALERLSRGALAERANRSEKTTGAKPSARSVSDDKQRSKGGPKARASTRKRRSA